jgi:NADH-quinone oxidoreductase subunit L
LSPVFAQSIELNAEQHLSHMTEYALMGTIIVFTLVMIGVAYTRYISKAHVPAAEGAELTSVHKTIYHKYFIDEIYDAVFVKPLYWISRFLDIVIEKSGIDRLVNLVSESLNDWSRIFRLLQNGHLGYYVFVMVMGVILMVAFSYTR